jgi:hypothetical protein
MKPAQICHTCREPVDPNDPDVLLAAQQVDVMGAVSRQYADGVERYFHRRHMPGGRSFREVAPASD